MTLLLAFGFPTSPNAQSNPGQAAPITARGEIFLNVNITSNEGKSLAGLPAEKFSLYLGKEQQKINYFTDKDMPASVLILFDMAGSMRSNPIYKDMGDTKGAFARFFKASNLANEYALLSFGSMAKPVQDWTADTDAILAGFDKIASDKPSGTSKLGAICLEGLEKLRSRPHFRRVILLVTDMYSTGDYKPGKLLHPLQETNPLIYIVDTRKLLYPFDADGGGGVLDMYGQMEFQQLAERSGGIVFFLKREEGFDGILQLIAENLRNQYLLSFRPSTSVKADKEYPLEVTVSFPPDAPKEVKDMKVRHRRFFIGQNR